MSTSYASCVQYITLPSRYIVSILIDTTTEEENEEAVNLDVQTN